MGAGRKKLHKTAARYIRALEPTHKQGSLNNYRAALRSFHKWLDGNELTLKDLERRHIVEWIGCLCDSCLAPSSLNHKIIFVRLYLRWLYEQELIESYPEDLIRTDDMVNEPKYLPRPISPASDKELQRRLASSSDIYHQGLLLMRRTGLRIGELMSLKTDCVRSDHLGNRFLKVPLGKLRTERLVPLDDDTLALIDKLRGSDRHRERKTFLLETKHQEKTRYPKYAVALTEVCQGLETNGKMVSHRLRHTYATALLNAGMSLVGLMKLLGHTDHRMTMRYAEISQATLTKEYFQALSRLEHRYAETLVAHAPKPLDPDKMLEDVVHLLDKLSANDNDLKPVARSINRRIRRIQGDIQRYFPSTRR